MKKIFFLATVFVASLSSAAQSPTDSIADTKNYINANIINNSAKAITANKVRRSAISSLHSIEALRDSLAGVTATLVGTVNGVAPDNGNVVVAAGNGVMTMYGYITQSGTSAPVVHYIHRTTTGTVLNTPSRTSTGVYHFIIDGFTGATPDNIFVQFSLNNNLLKTAIKRVEWDFDNSAANDFIIRTFNNAGAAADITATAPALFFKIEMYPLLHDN